MRLAENVNVRFSHYNPCNKREFAGDYGTHCCITNNEGKIRSQGFAKLSKRDQFNKEIGRKVALDRALNLSTIVSKSDRKTIWEAYFKR